MIDAGEKPFTAPPVEAERSLDSLDDCRSTLFELSQSGLFVKTPASRFLFVNRAFAEMLGYEPEELIGTSCRDLVVPEDLPAIRQKFSDSRWQADGMYELALRMYMKQHIGIRNVLVRYRRVAYQGRDAILGSVMDVTDLRLGEKALRDYASRLRMLSRQIIEVQENERRNLARELHDEIGQQLTLVRLSLEAVQARSNAEPTLDDALQNVVRLTQQVRDLSLDLRPSMLDDFGLVAALRWYVKRAREFSEIRAKLHVTDDFPRLQPYAETLFFRVAQEAVTNVLRHSGAQKLEVRLCVDGQFVRLEIVDDGCGFDPGKGRENAYVGRSAGLLGMQERASLAGAELIVDSSREEGTRLSLRLSASRAFRTESPGKPDSSPNRQSQ